MSFDVVLSTELPLTSFKKGKVRDIYDLGEKLLIVSTDRISAFDIVLPNGIPHKGEALNRLSTYWFHQTENIVQNHILDVVDPRTVLVKKVKAFKIEFVVRGYLYGSAWSNYVKEKPICGIRLPKGLKKAERLSEPVFTPTTKAEVGHDQDMTFQEVTKILGNDMAKKIEEVCFRIYENCSKRAEANGIILADTKMEFGTLEDDLIIIDELMTPDSSRIWQKKEYTVGKDQTSFDKQYVRDYLLSVGWDKNPPAPNLPEDVVTETSKKYIEAYERLTGRRF